MGDIASIRANQNATFSAAITAISAPREVTTSRGTSSVADATLQDETGTTTLTLWGDDISKYKVGTKIQITDGWVKDFKGKLQVSLGRSGKIDDPPVGELLSTTGSRPPAWTGAPISLSGGGASQPATLEPRTALRSGGRRSHRKGVGGGRWIPRCPGAKRRGVASTARVGPTSERHPRSVATLELPPVGRLIPCSVDWKVGTKPDSLWRLWTSGTDSERWYGPGRPLHDAWAMAGSRRRGGRVRHRRDRGRFPSGGEVRGRGNPDVPPPRRREFPAGRAVGRVGHSVRGWSSAPDSRGSSIEGRASSIPSPTGSSVPLTAECPTSSHWPTLGRWNLDGQSDGSMRNFAIRLPTYAVEFPLARRPSNCRGAPLRIFRPVVPRSGTRASFARARRSWGSRAGEVGPGGNGGGRRNRWVTGPRHRITRRRTGRRRRVGSRAVYQLSGSGEFVETGTRRAPRRRWPASQREGRPRPTRPIAT